MYHPLRRRPSRINQRNFKLAVAAIGVALVAGFFIYQFKFLRAPLLEITDPPADIVTDQLAFDVKGRTDPDADLTLNGRPLFSGSTGAFTERVYLFKGVNRLDLVARNRYGKTTMITRYIVVR